MLLVIEIIKLLYYRKPEPSLTWGEFKKEVFKIYPEKLIKKTIKELDEIQKRDIVALFDFDKYIEEDDE